MPKYCPYCGAGLKGPFPMYEGGYGCDGCGKIVPPNKALDSPPSKLKVESKKPGQTILDTWMEKKGTTPAPSTHPATPTPGGKKCPRCGKTNEPNNNFCIYCGAPLKAAPPRGPVGEPTAARPSGAPSGWRIRGRQIIGRPIQMNVGNWILVLIAFIVGFFPMGPLTAFNVIARIYIIAGLAAFNVTIVNPGGMFGTFLILLPLIWLFFGQTPLGQSILEQIGLSEYFTEAYLSLKYAGCYLGNAFNVNVLSVGNLNEFCNKQVYGFRAEKEGCIECLDYTVAPKTTAVPNRPLIVESVITIQSNSNAPAKNVVLRATDLDTGREAEITNNICSVEKPCKKLSKDDEPAVVRFKLDIPCKDHLQYKVIVSYDYVVQGTSEFKVRQAEEKVTTRPGGVTGKSSSGPLSFGIQSDSAEYVVGEDGDVYVNFYLYNEGRGKIRPKETTVTQIAPNKGEELEFVGCEGFVETDPIDKTKFVIKQFDVIPIRGSDLVTCKFKLPASIKSPFLTYKFIGVTEYSYELERKDSILIDLLNYPCKITGGRWKVYAPKEAADKPADNWYTEDYYDENWGIIDLPDKDWGCNDCTRYYRKYIYWNGFDKVMLKVRSDDGAACWVNGKNIFDDLSGAHEAGKRRCKNPILKTECEEWDYEHEITNDLKKPEDKAVKSVVACAVHNIEGKSYFDVGS